MVRAKFKVTEVKRSMSTGVVDRKEDGSPIYGNVEVQSVKLAPVYSTDPNSENKKFWDASPSGSIELGVVNQAAWSEFELDKEYYIDFTKAE